MLRRRGMRPALGRVLQQLFKERARRRLRPFSFVSWPEAKTSCRSVARQGLFVAVPARGMNVRDAPGVGVAISSAVAVPMAGANGHLQVCLSLRRDGLADDAYLGRQRRG